jgi:hypothetical protein
VVNSAPYAANDDDGATGPGEKLPFFAKGQLMTHSGHGISPMARGIAKEKGRGFPRPKID